MAHAARLVLAVLAAAFFATLARAEIGAGDQEAMKGIISSQIEAFKADDGDAAYQYASPNIRRLYPTVEGFMAMVRNGYPPVYRPNSVGFGEVVETPGGPQQRVFLTGPDGRGWVAIYTFERQPDGSWKINGVRLIEDVGPTI